MCLVFLKICKPWSGFMLGYWIFLFSEFLCHVSFLLGPLESLWSLCSFISILWSWFDEKLTQVLDCLMSTLWARTFLCWWCTWRWCMPQRFSWVFTNPEPLCMYLQGAANPADPAFDLSGHRLANHMGHNCRVLNSILERMTTPFCQGAWHLPMSGAGHTCRCEICFHFKP